MKIPSSLLNKLTYSGKCNDYTSEGNLNSSIFKDASDMAQLVEGDEVLSLTYQEFKTLLSAHEDFIAKGQHFQINVKEGVAWVYDEELDIHYFYSL